MGTTYVIKNIPNSTLGIDAANSLEMAGRRHRKRGRGARKDRSQHCDLPMSDASRFSFYIEGEWPREFVYANFLGVRDDGKVRVKLCAS